MNIRHYAYTMRCILFYLGVGMRFAYRISTAMFGFTKNIAFLLSTLFGWSWTSSNTTIKNLKNLKKKKKKEKKEASNVGWKIIITSRTKTITYTQLLKTLETS